ncbi:hypothetical protein L7F22_011556 [Adiantum nelumboides]|nr:hypothetical protein [Adiantum nelumboides]
MVSVMKLDKAPVESYAAVGGLEQQIQEIKGASNGSSPITHPSSAGTNASRPVESPTPAAAATAATPSFPPLGAKGAGAAPADPAESVQRDRMLYLLVGLVVSRVLGSSLGIVLSSAQQIVNETWPWTSEKDAHHQGGRLDSFSAKDVGLDVPVSMSSANRAGFRTDTEISKKALESFGEGRTLQKWADDPDSMLWSPRVAFGDAGGASSGGLGGWDQFAANESRFGVKSNYDETLYTTKLDKSAKDYRDRHDQQRACCRRAQPFGEGEEAQTEEDRFGAVVRSPNAYVPPAARRAAAVAAAAGAQSTIKANGAAREDKAANGAQSTSVAIPTITNTLAVKDGVDANNAAPHQAGPDAVGEFRQFVSSERERMEKKKAALAKKEKDTKLADLKNWGDKFKLKFPVSNETQGPEAESEQGARGKAARPKSAKEHESYHCPCPEAGQGWRRSERYKLRHAEPPRQRHGRSEWAVQRRLQSETGRDQGHAGEDDDTKDPALQSRTCARKADRDSGTNRICFPAALPSSKTAFKMSAKASSFKPFNPNAAAFTPGGAVAGGAPPSVSPRGAPSEASTVNSPLPTAAKASVLAGPVTPANPFFGSRVLKKTTPLDVREDFNPFKNGKVPESQTVGPTWALQERDTATSFMRFPQKRTSSTWRNCHRTHRRPWDRCTIWYQWQCTLMAPWDSRDLPQVPHPLLHRTCSNSTTKRQRLPWPPMVASRSTCPMEPHRADPVRTAFRDSRDSRCSRCQATTARCHPTTCHFRPPCPRRDRQCTAHRWPTCFRQAPTCTTWVCHQTKDLPRGTEARVRACRVCRQGTSAHVLLEPALCAQYAGRRSTGAMSAHEPPTDGGSSPAAAAARSSPTTQQQRRDSAQCSCFAIWLRDGLMLTPVTFPVPSTRTDGLA